MNKRVSIKSLSIEKQSPLTKAPLRYPGQSVHNAIRDTIFGQLFPYLLIPMVILGFVIAEYVHWFFKIPPSPNIATLIFVLSTLLAMYKSKHVDKKLNQLKQAFDGEKLVAEQLDTLRDEGFRVLHDLVNEKGNIDHILVGPKGVFTVETKTWSKRHSDKIIFDGENIFIKGLSPTRDPINQAKGQAFWLYTLLKSDEEVNRYLKNQQLYVNPIVLFPGWDIEYTCTETPVGVCNPKELTEFLNQKKDLLSSNDIIRVTAVIKKYIRNYELQNQ